MVSSPIPPAGHIPPQFLQTIVDLDAGVTKTVAAEKSATKKMTGAKAKAVTGLKQTIKKKNKEFEMVLSTFKEVRPTFYEVDVTDNTGPGSLRISIREGKRRSRRAKSSQEDTSCRWTGTSRWTGRELLYCWTRWTSQDFYRSGCFGYFEGDCRTARSKSGSSLPS
jgi:hypothetical protein